MAKTQTVELGERTYTVELLSDDGHGHRLWIERKLDRVVNEDYDVETGDSTDWNQDVAGWGYEVADALEFA